jgi:hypothetical protein
VDVAYLDAIVRIHLRDSLRRKRQRLVAYDLPLRSRESASPAGGRPAVLAAADVAVKEAATRVR